MSKILEDEAMAVMDFLDVIKYVDATNTLLECIGSDLAKGKTYTVKTIVALSNLASAATAMQPLLKHVEKAKLDIN